MADPVIDAIAGELQRSSAASPGAEMPALPGAAANGAASIDGSVAALPPDDAVTRRHEQQWQWVLLPVLALLIAGMAVFFLWATKSQLDALQTQIYTAPRVRVDSMFAAVAVETAGWDRADRMAYTQWRTLAELEARALDRRYHQVNVLLMARTWTRYLGFVTGMIMALMGAGFILGKFRETSTAVQVKSSPVSAALSTTSPGLFLATLGTALMITTIVVHNDIETRDVPMYTNGYTLTSDSTTRPSSYPAVGPAASSPDDILSRHGLGTAAPGTATGAAPARQP